MHPNSPGVRGNGDGTMDLGLFAARSQAPYFEQSCYIFDSGKLVKPAAGRFSAHVPMIHQSDGHCNPAHASRSRPIPSFYDCPLDLTG